MAWLGWDGAQIGLAWVLLAAGCGGPAAGNDPAEEPSEATGGPDTGPADAPAADSSTTADVDGSGTGADESSGEDDATGDTTGEPEVPFGFDVIVAQRPVAGESRVERYRMEDGELIGPTQLNAPLGEDRLGTMVPEIGGDRLLYTSDNDTDDNLYVAQIVDDGAVVQQLDVGLGHAVQSIDLRWLPGIDAVGSWDAAGYNVAIDRGANTWTAAPAVYDDPTFNALNTYRADPSTGLLLVGEGDGGRQSLFVADLSDPNPSALQPIYAPVEAWEGVSGFGLLPDGQGVYFMSDRTADNQRDLFVAMVDGDGYAEPVALTAIDADTRVGSVTPHRYTGGLIYRLWTTSQPEGPSELYWVDFVDNVPQPAVPLNAGGTGRTNPLSTRRFSSDERLLVYKGSPVDDGSPLRLRVVDFEGGAPGPAQPVGETAETSEHSFFGTDRWLFFAGSKGDLWRADVLSIPIAPELISEMPGATVRTWDISVDDARLCFVRWPDPDQPEAPEVSQAVFVVGLGDVLGEPVQVGEPPRDTKFLRGCRFTADGRGVVYAEGAAPSPDALTVVDLAFPEQTVARIETVDQFAHWEPYPFTALRRDPG